MKRITLIVLFFSILTFSVSAQIWGNSGGCNSNSYGGGGACCWTTDLSDEVNDGFFCEYEGKATPGGYNNNGNYVEWYLDVYRVDNLNVFCGYKTPCEEFHFFNYWGECNQINVTFNFSICGTINIGGTGGSVQAGPFDYFQSIEVDNTDRLDRKVICCREEIEPIRHD